MTPTATKRRVGRPKKNKGLCLIRGCPKPSSIMGMCQAHYRRHKRGRPLNDFGFPAAGTRAVRVVGRVSEKRVKLLRGEAKKRGFDSLYQMVSELLGTTSDQALIALLPRRDRPGTSDLSPS